MLRQALGPAQAAQLILELDLPPGWFYRPGPGHSTRVDGEVGWVSNVALPPLECSVQLPDDEVCTLSGVDLEPDKFLLTLLRYTGGLPSHDPAASPLPDGVERVMIGGRPASRVIHDPGGDGRRGIGYELVPPGDSGYWILALNVGADGFEAVVAEVESVLARGTIVEQD